MARAKKLTKKQMTEAARRKVENKVAAKKKSKGGKNVFGNKAYNGKY